LLPSNERAAGENRINSNGSEVEMLAVDQIEELICVLSTWDRRMLISQFETFRSSFPVDFTPEFLGRAPVEKLRHLFLALCLQNQRLPELGVAA
jgi:hypothetical protein